MTLIERLRVEADILILMQNEHLRFAVHCLGQYQGTQNVKYLAKAFKAQHWYEFNQNKIEWLESLIKEFS